MRFTFEFEASMLLRTPMPLESLIEFKLACSSLSQVVNAGVIPKNILHGHIADPRFGQTKEK